MGTYNTVKATIDHLRKTKGSYIHLSVTLHYKGTSPDPVSQLASNN
jgi:peroxisomal 2,4-dienoyl-CoA reductase